MKKLPPLQAALIGALVALANLIAGIFMWSMDMRAEGIITLLGICNGTAIGFIRYLDSRNGGNGNHKSPLAPPCPPLEPPTPLPPR